jgi:hypothetical protein
MGACTRRYLTTNGWKQFACASAACAALIIIITQVISNSGHIE